jgi:hypothetical protein
LIEIALKTPVNIMNEKFIMECGCHKKQTTGNTKALLSKAQQDSRISSLLTTPHQTGKERFVSRLEYRERLEICKECEKVKYLFGRIRCGVCGCFLEIKAAVPLMKCPLGKW